MREHSLTVAVKCLLKWIMGDHYLTWLANSLCLSLTFNKHKNLTLGNFFPPSPPQSSFPVLISDIQCAQKSHTGYVFFHPPLSFQIHILSKLISVCKDKSWQLFIVVIKVVQVLCTDHKQPYLCILSFHCALVAKWVCPPSSAQLRGITLLV